MAKSNDILKRYGIYSSTQKDEEEEKENSKAESVLEKYGLDSRPASGQDKSAGNDILKKYGLTPIRGTGIRNPTPEQSARNAIIDYGIKTDSINRYISQNPYDPNDNTMRYYQNQAKRVPTEIDDYIKTLSAAGIGEDHPYYQSLDSFKQYYADLEKGFENAYKQTPEYAMLNYDSEAGQKEIDLLKQKEAGRNSLRGQLNFLQAGGGAAGSYAAASGMYTQDEREAEIERLQEELVPYANVDTELEQAQSMKYYSENLQKYNEIQNRADFTANSQYRDTGTGGWWNGGIQAAFNFSDATDRAYEFINNQEEIQSAMGEGFNSIGQVNVLHLDLMEPDERKMFTYLYNTQGKDAASEYLDYIQPELNRRNMQNIADQEKAYAQQNFGTGLLASIGSVPNSLAGGLGALDVTLQKIQRDITGEYKPIDYNTNAMIPSVRAAAAREAVSQSIVNATGVIEIDEEQHPYLAKIFNGKSLADVYNLGMSIADSAAAAVFTKGLAKIGVPQKLASGLGSSLLGGNAASQGMIEAIANGATDEQALQLGLMNGLYESLFEAVSIDNLTKDTATGFFKTMLKQGGVEASEEAMTTIANTFADIAIMAENSGYEKSVTAYMEQGMSREEAEKKAFLDSVVQVGWDAFGGFLSGGVSAGGKYAVGSVIENQKANKQNKQLYGESIDELVSEGMELTPDNKFVQKMQGKIDAGKDLSGRQITRLVNQNDKAIRSSVQQDAAQRLTELGETGNVQIISAVLAKQAMGEELSNAEQRVLSSSKYGNQVAEELRAAPEQQTGETAESVEEKDTGDINDGRVLAEIGRQEATADPTQTVSNEQTAVIDNSERVPSGLVESAPHITSLEQEQSTENPVSIDEIAQKYGAQSSAVKAVYNIGSNQDVKQFDSAFERVFNYAQSGTVRLDGVKKLESIRSVLTDKQIELAYETGTAAANTAARNLEANNLAQANGKNGWKTGVVKGEGVSVEYLKKTFNDTQSIVYKLMSTFAEATGIDIVLYQSEMDANGNFQGAQGRFKRGEPGTIYIDINAGLNGKHDVGNLAKYTMLRTFSHEFTHFIEKWNPVQYNEFRKVVFDTLRERGENVDDLVEAKQATGLSYDMASREVVAEAMTDILPDTHFVQNLAEKHKSIFQKLMEKLKEFVEDLRSYFNSLGKNRSREANALKEQVGETVRYVENIVKMFDQVAEQAVENYQLTVAVDEVTGGITIEEKPVAEVAEENVTETEDPVVPSTQELENSAAPVAPTENTEVKAAARRSSGSKKKTSLTSLLQFVKKASDERLRGAYTAQDGKQYLTDGSFVVVFNSADSTLEHKADFPIDVVTSFLSAAHKQQNTETYRIDDSEIRTLNRTATKKNRVLVKVGSGFFNVKYVYALSRAFENPVYSLYQKKYPSKDISILRVSADNGEAILLPVLVPENTQAAYEAKLSNPHESSPSDETTAVAQKAPETSAADELVDTKASEEYAEPQNGNIEKKSATKKSTASHTVETSVKLEDFGEKIGGAKFSDVISESFDLEQEQRRDYIDEGYVTDSTNWAYENFIIDETDRARFYEVIADLNKRNYSVPRNKNGVYMIEHNNKIMFTDGDFKAPTLSKVIVFDTNYDANMAYAKGLIFDEERRTAGHGEAVELLNRMYGDGFIHEYNVRNYQRNDWQDGRGEGSNRRSAGKAGSGRRIFKGQYQERTSPLTDRDVLEAAANDIGISDMSDAEQAALQTFKDRLTELHELQDKRAEAGRLYKEQQFGANVDRQAASQTLERMRALDDQIKTASVAVLDVEQKSVLQRVLKKARKVVEQQERDRSQAVLKRWRDRRDNADAVKKYRARVEKSAKALIDMLSRPTKDAHVPYELQEPLQELLDSIDFTSKTQNRGGAPTIRDRAYTSALHSMRLAIAGQRTAIEGAENGAYSLDVPPEFLNVIDEHVQKINQSVKSYQAGTSRVYDMTSSELADLAYLLVTINKAIRDIDKLHMAGAKARISELAVGTMQEMRSRKPVKGDSGNRFIWANYTPWYAFRAMGKDAQKIFKGLMQGQAKLARTSHDTIAFTEKTYKPDEAKNWEQKIHTIELSSGETIRMTTAQIMSFWCLSNRQQGVGHLTGGGIRIGKIRDENFRRAAQNQRDIVQKEHFVLTLDDIAAINGLLTERQRTVARELQQYMQNVGGRLGNEISMARWDFMQFTEDGYFPIQTDDATRDAKNPGQDKTNLWALLNKSFTKSLTPNAKNAVIVNSIFDVFADHMTEMAEYNAFALPLVDAMKWFNYRQRQDLGDGQIADVGVQKSIRDTLGTAAVKYFVDLMTDLNSSQKAGRHENILGQILSRTKAASVGWNLRVAVQQPTAILRASMFLSMPDLLKGSMRIGTSQSVKEMQQYSGIALWKSMGFYDVNVSRGVREQIKGNENILDKFNSAGMWLPGKMDAFTWARIWEATKAKVRREQHLTGEPLLKATAELFEDIVYQSQVADSILTRSSFMRSKSQAMREATSFMSEPTLSSNILISAFQDFEAGHTTWDKTKRALVIGFEGYVLAGVVNAMVTALMDAWRDDDKYETFWEKYLQAFFGENSILDGNLFSEMNPLEKIIFVRDALSIIRGYDVMPGYADLFKQGYDFLTSAKDFFTDRGSMTLYGLIYRGLQVLGTTSGIAFAGLSREAIALHNNVVLPIWNKTFGQMYPNMELSPIRRYEPSGNTEIKNTFLRGYLTEEEAISELVQQGLSDTENDAYFLVQGWSSEEEDYTRYSKVFDAVRNNGDFNAALNDMVNHGYERDTVIRQVRTQIGQWYQGGEISKSQATQMLKKYVGLDNQEVTEQVNRWSSYVVTGIKFDDIKQAYLDGEITLNRAIEMYALYGSYTKERATEIVSKWGSIKETGYEIDELDDAYFDGEVGLSTVRSMYIKYGGYTAEEAGEKTTVLEFVKQNPACDGISYAAVSGYNDYCKQTGVDPATFYNAWKFNNSAKNDYDSDGEVTISKKEKVMDYIDGLNLTKKQKDSLYYALDYAESTLNEAPWH